MAALSLEEKVKVIQRSEKNRESARKIAESLGVGKTQILNREAIFMVNELKKYALSRNETGLTQALTEAEELIEHSVLKNSSRLRQSTLSNYFSVA